MTVTYKVSSVFGSCFATSLANLCIILIVCNVQICDDWQGDSVILTISRDAVSVGPGEHRSRSSIGGHIVSIPYPVDTTSA